MKYKIYLHSDRDRVISYSFSNKSYHETTTLPKIDIPVLAIAGRADIAAVPVASRRMSMDLPKAELAILQPTGHMRLMERNEQFADTVRSFSTVCLSFKR